MPRTGNRIGGFTLVEMVVGISLIGLILSLAFGAIRTATRSWDAAVAKEAETENLRAVYGFIRAELEQARPAFLEGKDERQNAFSGDGRRLNFVAPMPAQRRYTGRLYLYTLQFGEGWQSGRMELRYQPFSPDMEMGSGEAETLVLLRQVSDGEFAYFGRRQPDEEPRWHERWERQDAMPALVRIRLKTAARHGNWPELVIPIRVTGEP